MEGVDEMRRQSLMLGAGIAAMAMAAGALSLLAYRRDIRAIREKVASGGRIARTSVGPIEYAEEGDGPPLLLIHDAGGGYDQGLSNGANRTQAIGWQISVLNSPSLVLVLASVRAGVSVRNGATGGRAAYDQG